MNTLRVRIFFLVLLLEAAVLMSAVSARAQSRGGGTKRPPLNGAKVSAPSSAAFEQLSKRAAAARESERLEEAIGLYRQALRQRPAWAEGWWYLGTTLYELDRYAEALGAFKRLVTIEPRGGVGWALMGLCEYQLGQYEHALDHVRRGRALGLGGNEELTFVVRYHHALLLTRFAQFEAAFEILFALARTQGDNPRISEALGLSVLRLPLLPAELAGDKRELVTKAGQAAHYWAARRLPDAQRKYEELVARYPRTPNVHYAYGIFLLPGDPDAALAAFRRELQISNTHVPALLQIAFEYLKRRDYAAGLPFAEQAVKLVPLSFAARNALGRILLGMGEVKRAIRELEIGVKLAPDSPEMHFALAGAYARDGRKTDAKREHAIFGRLDGLRRARQQAAQPLSAPEPE